jgi:ribosomal protein S18 acetylase RimI-like enzyme
MPGLPRTAMTSAPSPIRTVAPPGLTFRRVEDHDLPFLARLYASTRREELEPVPWSDQQKAEFLQWQFESQHRYYQEYYPSCEFLIVERAVEGGGESDGEAIGRLYVDRWADQIRIVDISLLPEHRGAGLGESLLRAILAESEASRLPLTIHVEYNNPALRLYRRLGFEQVDSNGPYLLMRRRV